MEELLELKELLINGEFEEALTLVGDLEEMGKKGISNNIRAYAKVLLLYLIKQHVENRTTKSWNVAIDNAIREILNINTRFKGKGTYLDNEELYEIIFGAMDSAINEATIQCCEGIYDRGQIREMIDEIQIISLAHLVVSKDEE